MKKIYKKLTILNIKNSSKAIFKFAKSTINNVENERF